MRIDNPQLGLARVCRLFGITRQAYYNYKKRTEKKYLENDQVLKMVKAIREVHPRIGCRKIYTILKDDFEHMKIKIGRDKLFDLLSDNQLLIRKRKRRIRTTNSHHSFRKYKNIIKNFIPYKANQLWVSDITYLKKGETFSYLFLITDAYSKKILGYNLAETLETKNAIISLRMAIDSSESTEGIIHHSDRGLQYCSRNYVKLLQDYKIEISMTEDSKPTDKSIAERVNGILKEEYIEPLKKSSNYDLAEVIDQAVLRYNNYRPHMSCDMMTPKQAHHSEGILRKRWKNYYPIQQVNH